MNMAVVFLSKKDGNDQESTQHCTTPDPGISHGKMTKSQIGITNKSQEVSPFPAGDHKAAMNIRENMTRKHDKHKT